MEINVSVDSHRGGLRRQRSQTHQHFNTWKKLNFSFQNVWIFKQYLNKSNNPPIDHHGRGLRRQRAQTHARNKTYQSTRWIASVQMLVEHRTWWLYFSLNKLIIIITVDNNRRGLRRQRAEAHEDEAFLSFYLSFFLSFLSFFLSVDHHGRGLRRQRASSHEDEGGLQPGQASAARGQTEVEHRPRCA